MKVLVILLIVWFICGLYGWGTAMADFNWKDNNEWQILKQTPRDNAGFAAAIAMAGPIGAVAAMICTNFNQHGWELWGSK